MFRTLLVIAVLALSGCASYGGTQYRERVVYRDGSYYSPSADGYGDYYYAPDYRYSDYDYYDPWGYGFGYGWTHPWAYGFNSCGLRYRPCPYGYGYWGPGWGFSLFYDDPWSGWPYYYGDRHHHWRGRDHDWDRDHDRDRDRNRRDHDDDQADQPHPTAPGGDPNARDPNAAPPRTSRPPFVIRDPSYGEEPRERTPREDRNDRRPFQGVPSDSNLRPSPRVGRVEGDPNARTPYGFQRPAPPPRQDREMPAPRERVDERPAPQSRDRDEDRREPPRMERPRPAERAREDRGTRPRPGQ